MCPYETVAFVSSRIFPVLRLWKDTHRPVGLLSVV